MNPHRVRDSGWVQRGNDVNIYVNFGLGHTGQVTLATELGMTFSFRDARPVKRQGFWYFVRRVPSEFRMLDKREMVTQSTGIRVGDDPRGVVARRRVKELDEALQQFWRCLRAGRDPEHKAKYEAVVREARHCGLEYLDRSSLAEMPIIDLVKRLQVLHASEGHMRDVRLPAMMGTVPAPGAGTLVSEMLEVTEEIYAASLRKKSPEQLKRWKGVRQTAIETFTSIIGGDKAVRELIRMAT